MQLNQVTEEGTGMPVGVEDDTAVELTLEEIVAERQAAGEQLLGRLRPGWHGRADRRSLDLGSLELCVLGQEFGSFNAGMRALFGDVDGLVKLRLAADYGFAPCEDDCEDEPLLREAWRRAIERRPRGDEEATRG